MSSSGKVAGSTYTTLPIRVVGNRFRKLTVMLYHSVPTLSVFQGDCDFFQEWNYTTVTMDDVWNHLQGNSTLPDKPLLITFDDGLPTQYAAVQELNSRGMKSTLYVATGWIDGTVTQGQAGFAEATPLTWTQIIQMKAWGCDIQSHTVQHQDQQTISIPNVVAEFLQSKTRIQAQVAGQIVSHLAYPYGSWNNAIKAALQSAGCKLARVVRVDTDGAYPGPNLGRLTIASTLSDPLAIPTSGTGNGDIQYPNFYRTIASNPEWVPDFSFEGGGKGWSLGAGFSVDTNIANAHNDPANGFNGVKSLTCVQGAATVSSHHNRTMPIGPWNRLQIKGWIKSTLPAGSYAKIQLQTLKYDAATINATTDIAVLTGPGAYTAFNFEYIGGPNDAYAVIYTAVQGNASPSGQAWFDDISVRVENMPSND